MASDIPSTAPLSINGRTFVHDITQYRRRTLESVRSAIDQSATGGEQSLSTEGYWRRSQRRWIYGTGQVVFDSADLGSDSTIQRQRYLNAWNCEPDTDTLEGVRMIRRDATALSGTGKVGPDAPGLSCTAGGYSYIITRDVGSGAHNVLAINSAGITICTGFGSDVPWAVATDGLSIWVLAATSTTTFTMYTTTWTVSPTAFAAMSAGAQALPTGTVGPAVFGQTRAFYANGVLLVSYRNAVVSVDKTGLFGSTIDVISPVSSVSGVAAQPIIIQMAATTNTWFFVLSFSTITDTPLALYKLTLDSTGTFGKASVALPALGPTECMNAVKVVGNNIMLIGTTLGFRAATIGSDGNLNVGPLNAVVSPDTVGAPNFGVNAFAFFGNKVLASYTSTSEPFSDGVASTFKTGRTGNGTIVIDVGRFVDVLQPAWWYWWRKATSADSHTAAFICENPTNPVFAEYDLLNRLGTANLVTPCSFLTSWVTASMDYSKTFIDLEIFHDALASGDSIAVYTQVEDAGTTWVLIGTSNTAASTTTTVPIPIAVSSRRMRFGFVMTANSASQGTTPRLRRWQLRVFPDPINTDEVIAAIMLSEDVEVGEAASAKFHQDTLEAYQFLQALVTAGSVVPLIEGSTTTSVKVDRLEMQPTQYAMNTDGSYKGYQGLVVTRMLSL